MGTGPTYTYRDPRIDSRDMLERLEALAGREDPEDGDPLDESETEELATLRALQDETEGYSDSWRDGIFFVADRDFERYAEELADDIGAIDRNATWPLDHIDWESAAEALQMDYTSCEIYGRTYWYR